MDIYNIHYSSEAFNDLDSIYCYIAFEQAEPIIAKAIYKIINCSIEGLRTFPKRYPLLEFGDEKHFNFNITYNSFLDSTFSYSIFPKAVYNYLFQSINKLYFIDNKNIKIIKHDNFLCFDSNKNLNNIINQLPPFRIIFEKNGIFF